MPHRISSHPRALAKASARERLLIAANQLFYSNGIGATGIDAVIAQAGVAKKSLYNNFSSKSELILDYLKARHEEWLELYNKRLQQAETSKEKVLSVFDAYLDHADLAATLSTNGFRGCGALNVSAELASDDVGRVLVRQQKNEIKELIEHHVLTLISVEDEERKARAACFAQHLSFLLEGAVVRAGLEGRRDFLIEARVMACHLLDTL